MRGIIYLEYINIAYEITIWVLENATFMGFNSVTNMDYYKKCD